MADEAVDERYCSNGTACVAYPSLGEPAKLSRGNPSSICFACEKLLADAVALETPIPKEKAKRKPTERDERFLVGRKARLRAKRQPRRGEGRKGRPREAPYPAELVNLELAAKRRGHTLHPWYQRSEQIWIASCARCGLLGWVIRPAFEPWRPGGDLLSKSCVRQPPPEDRRGTRYEATIAWSDAEEAFVARVEARGDSYEEALENVYSAIRADL